MSPIEFWKTSGYSIEPYPMKSETPQLMSNRIYSPVKPIAPHSTPRRLLRFPSGLEVEDMTERNPRPLWPLVLCALLVWAAVAGCAYFLAA